MRRENRAADSPSNKTSMRLPLALVCLLLSSCSLVRGERKKGVRKAERRLARQTKNDGLGATTVATEPLHRARCGDRWCRPGEGNLKGYKHWSMPWQPPPIDGLTKAAPHGWSGGAPFPAAAYSQLIAAATKLVGGSGSGSGGDKLLVFAAADFDFRLLGGAAAPQIQTPKAADSSRRTSDRGIRH
jgi:hypothetical protein